MAEAPHHTKPRVPRQLAMDTELPQESLVLEGAQSSQLHTEHQQASQPHLIQYTQDLHQQYHHRQHPPTQSGGQEPLRRNPPQPLYDPQRLQNLPHHQKSRQWALNLLNESHYLREEFMKIQYLEQQKIDLIQRNADLEGKHRKLLEDLGRYKAQYDQRSENSMRQYETTIQSQQAQLERDSRQYGRSITDLQVPMYSIFAVRQRLTERASNDAGRSLMGPRQETWFYRQLTESAKREATWRIIGSQIVFSHPNLSLSFGPKNPPNYDSWDGYQSNRNRTYAHLYDNHIGNNIMLAGDSHASWVSDLVWLGEKPYDGLTGAGAVGVEFVGTAALSSSPRGAERHHRQRQRGEQVDGRAQ